MGIEVGWGRNSKADPSMTDFEMRLRWEVAETGRHFYRIFKVPLLSFVGGVVAVLSPPQSIGLQFQFGPGMREKFIAMVSGRMMPSTSLQQIRKSFLPKILIPDDPGAQNADRWWRRLAAGAGIGASFREEGSDTSLHIAFNDTVCDVHLDRSGSVMQVDGRVYWKLNNLIRHFSLDYLGDKLPWLLVSASYVRANKPIVEATLGPWIFVDLPSRDNDGRASISGGLVITGVFQ